MMNNNPFLIYNEHNAPITPATTTIRITTSTQSKSALGSDSPASPSAEPKNGLYALEAELDAMLHPKSTAQDHDSDSSASYSLSEKEIGSSPQIHVWAAETPAPPKTPLDPTSSGQRSTKLTRLFTRSGRFRGSTRKAKHSQQASPSPQLNASDAEWEKQAETLALFEPPATSPPTHIKKQARLSIFGPKNSAHASPRDLSRSSSPVGPVLPSKEATTQNLALTFSQSTDQRLQEAIELHDAGNLTKSTAMFEELADPASINHPLAQVLFGLACRHGWGVAVNEERAFRYIRLAAGNSALVDQILSSSSSSGTASTIKPSAHNKCKSGFAKGELVLSIYELGNCFRYGWGTARDPVLAKQYYETAARLGDVDAMLECAWCYMTGFGIRKKDKYAAAQYYRMAERAGRVEVGNSWIWYVNFLFFFYFFFCPIAFPFYELTEITLGRISITRNNV